MMNFDIQVTVPNGVMFRDLEGEAVLLELGTGRYFGLNETGTRIWLLLQEHGSVEQVLRAMAEEFDVAEDLLRSELLSFLDTLISQKLLEVHG